MKLKQNIAVGLVCGVMLGVAGFYTYFCQSIYASYIQERLEQIKMRIEMVDQSHIGSLAVTGDDDGCVPPIESKKEAQPRPSSHEEWA